MPLPLPSYESVMASTAPNSTYMLGVYMPVAYMEVGVLIGALLVVFLVSVFTMFVRGLMHKKTWAIEWHKDSDKFN